MDGRAAASMIASASLRSFLLRLKDGFTYDEDQTTLWPYPLSPARPAEDWPETTIRTAMPGAHSRPRNDPTPPHASTTAPPTTALMEAARSLGHVHAFAVFGKLSAPALCDIDSCLASKILPDGTHQRAKRFSSFLPRCLFRDRYGRTVRRLRSDGGAGQLTGAGALQNQRSRRPPGFRPP